MPERVLTRVGPAAGSCNPPGRGTNSPIYDMTQRTAEIDSRLVRARWVRRNLGVRTKEIRAVMALLHSDQGPLTKILVVAIEIAVSRSK